ncbi:uncharacterized protein L3040_005273 [Drepanopeziza brunnea f. sp. 'multigermtubi']|uniref:Uncharacterized protein n=1 Tax=Marssonina brunnea f. sp. multigermtubi (strain MB_m1) TaxID=1072389 RepID=K1WKE8_MARBU|nr:uncharacterized protein MBM_09256 [Drepanopeziza brunnea f. sp. 'multigermtubi' MB_m1]EKD12687.1 hypothetical protein MBM_09256 [Drepanopeziza brunnea f. sp. 'multigermtubi' MB_m1]KAJ5041703.1 hypothetical protein L3040_005273 [Drepanopeziza brunnea f. sp. 'multigermtubi']
MNSLSNIQRSPRTGNTEFEESAATTVVDPALATAPAVPVDQVAPAVPAVPAASPAGPTTTTTTTRFRTPRPSRPNRQPRSLLSQRFGSPTRGSSSSTTTTNADNTTTTTTDGDREMITSLLAAAGPFARICPISLQRAGLGPHHLACPLRNCTLQQLCDTHPADLPLHMYHGCQLAHVKATCLASVQAAHVTEPRLLHRERYIHCEDTDPLGGEWMMRRAAAELTELHARGEVGVQT